ncbi:RNA polymerase sigma factor [Chitinophaga filiformis]|uniref:RNA polymerase sigma-70 factor, ECF subfamily n=1 Tax=Chitinophaga filiformis TaxID=104663 RepID=A0A1G7R0T8_CHIFI|nr:sigma-70 family RNA polymerase sigma factor [Chitinophaga filiformis]SDG04376.1 RNA polymerase sigma-70 factor, ECF subfamily [Chitinophaga filiformis]
MNTQDAELVVKLVADDVSAFDALYWKYHQAVYRNIFKFVKEPIATEDILQEVFARLWEKRKDINAGQSVAGWLFVISFNLSVDYVRKKLREHTFHKELYNLNIETSNWEDNPGAYEEQYRLLEDALSQLSPKKQKIVTLCKLEGKTYDEVAEELKISRNTVKEHLSIAMSRINEYIQKNKEHKYVLLLLLMMKN